MRNTLLINMHNETQIPGQVTASHHPHPSPWELSPESPSFAANNLY